MPPRQLMQQATRLGPFVGGLNNQTDPAIIQDTELAECVNFEVDIDGSLVNRPSFDLAEVTYGSEFTHGGGENNRFLCTFIYEDDTYLIYTDSGTTQYALPLSDGSFEIGTIAHSPTEAAVQYVDKLWLFAAPGSGDPGVWWTPDDGLSSSIANMGEAAACVVYKDRIFAVPGISTESSNPERLHFSEVGDPTVWNGSDFIDIGQGDGQKLVDVVVYQDNLLLFKENSTYVFAYDSAPESGVLRQVHTNVGAASQKCVVVYENSAYVLHHGYLWEITNYNFNRINLKCLFEYTRTLETILGGTFNSPTFVCLLGERLFVRFYDRIYVYGIRTKTWSLWESLDDHVQSMGWLLRIPDDTNFGTTPRYIAGSVMTSLADDFYVIRDTPAEGYFENLEDAGVPVYCRIKTKDYDFNTSHKFKRLWWWGVECVAYDNIDGTVTAVVHADYVTWGELAPYQWGELENNQWLSPLSASPSYITEADVDNVTRIFVRFPHALRFRRVNFEVELNTFQTLDTGAVRIFSITGLIDPQRQTVPEEIN